MKNKKNNSRGFTLVELLLVMAIIGILAGAVMVGISTSRKRAKVTATLKTANNITAELADCYLNNKNVSIPPNAGDQICPGAGKWPDISDKSCTYTTPGYNVNTHVLMIDCLNNYATIICDVTDGNCKIIYN